MRNGPIPSHICGDGPSGPTRAVGAGGREEARGAFRERAGLGGPALEAPQRVEEARFQRAGEARWGEAPDDQMLRGWVLATAGPASGNKLRRSLRDGGAQDTDSREHPPAAQATESQRGSGPLEGADPGWPPSSGAEGGRGGSHGGEQTGESTMAFGAC